MVRATKRINSECADKGDVQGARALLERLILGRGLKPTLVTANILMKTYRNSRDPEGAEHVLREFPSWGLAPDACTFSTLVDAYGLVNRLPDAKRMVSTAEQLGAVDWCARAPLPARAARTHSVASQRTAAHRRA